MKLGVVVHALLVAWLACAAGVRAQSEAAAPATAGASDRYEDLVVEAVREFNAGNFVEARALFEPAHTLRPSARTLRGLGLCAYELKHYVQAVGELEAALVDTRNALTDEQRAEVTTTLAKARHYVGTLLLQANPAQASVLIDGAPVAVRKLRLDAGDHLLSAEAPGYRSSEQKFSVFGGRESTVHVVLLPLELSPARAASTSASAATRSSATQPTMASDHSAESRSVLSRWWFWTAAGVVVAGAAVGTALALNGGSKSAQLDTGNTHLQLQPP